VRVDVAEAAVLYMGGVSHQGVVEEMEL